MHVGSNHNQTTRLARHPPKAQQSGAQTDGVEVATFLAVAAFRADTTNPVVTALPLSCGLPPPPESVVPPLEATKAVHHAMISHLLWIDASQLLTHHRATFYPASVHTLCCKDTPDPPATTAAHAVSLLRDVSRHA